MLEAEASLPATCVVEVTVQMFVCLLVCVVQHAASAREDVCLSRNADASSFHRGIPSKIGRLPVGVALKPSPDAVG